MTALLLTLSVLTYSPVEKFKTFLDTLQTALVTFDETVLYYETGMQRSFSGKAYYKRGKGLRLEFTSPDEQVIILADTTYLVWNKRRNRVFRRKMDFKFPKNRREFDGRYTIQQTTNRDTIVFTIQDRERYGKVEVGFIKQGFKPIYMTIYGDGSRSTYRFKIVKINSWVPDSKFNVEDVK